MFYRRSNVTSCVRGFASTSLTFPRDTLPLVVDSRSLKPLCVIMTDTTAATAPVDAPAPKRSRPEAAATHLAGALHTMSAIKAPTPLPRSHGLIKSLYSDFIVREIAFTTREPVVLQSLVVPPEIATKSSRPPHKRPARARALKTFSRPSRGLGCPIRTSPLSLPSSTARKFPP